MDPYAEVTHTPANYFSFGEDEKVERASTLRAALMSDGCDTAFDFLGKRARLRGTLEREAVAAAARLPVMKRRRGTSVYQISRHRAEQHQLHPHTQTHTILTHTPSHQLPLEVDESADNMSDSIRKNFDLIRFSGDSSHS